MKKTYNTEAAIPPETEETQGVMSTDTPKELSQQDQAYISGIMKLMHSKKTAPMVEEMLQAGPPEDVIPKIAMMLNDQMEKAVGQKPSLETLLAAFIALVQDLIELGNVGGFWKIDSEEQIGLILKTTLQTYIEKGLKDGTIDPVELQEKAGALMSEEQKQQGMSAGSQYGVPTEANQNTAMASYGSKMERQGMMKGPQAGGAV